MPDQILDSVSVAVFVCTGFENFHPEKAKDAPKTRQTQRAEEKEGSCTHFSLPHLTIYNCIYMYVQCMYDGIS